MAVKAIDISNRNLAFEFSHRLVHFAHADDCYYFLFNLSTARFDYLSPGVEKVLGYPAKELPADLFVELWHSWPDSGKSPTGLPKDKAFKYKLRPSFRIRRKDGTYTKLVHQTMGFDTNDDGSVLRIFGVHTDIGYLKAEKPLLIKGALSNREQEILVMIMDGMLNKEIAVRLNISKATVDRHRKNMLGKTGCKNSGELIARAIKDGWV